MSRSLIFAVAALPLAMPLAAQTAGTAERQARSVPGAQLVTGLEYKKGSYGTSERLETFSAPNSLHVSKGQLQFSASLPYVRIDGPANLVGGGGLLGLPIIIDPTRPGTRSRRQGIGDLRAAAAYTLPTSSVGMTFSGEVKLPTASRRKGLGTGATDLALGAELSKSIGPVTPFVGLGYTLPGDPEGFELRNAVSARAGAAVQMSSNLRAHVAYGHAQSVSAEIEEERQISTGLNANLSNVVSLGVYGSAGLSETAPDIGAGIQLGIRIR
jgi:hypothetical protein